MTESITIDGIEAGTWVLDSTHSEIGFTVRHLMSKVHGKFDEFEGSIVVAGDGQDSRGTATVALTSINTGTPDRDNHLRSSDFFSIEDAPEMAFLSTHVVPDGDNYRVTGDLTIKGVTKPIELEVEVLGVGADPWGGRRVGFEAHGQISRKDWGIDFNIPVQGEKMMIGDKISIDITAEAVLEQN